ncbi:MAG: ribonuclease Y [Patescibacteria group bacterium]|nr:ribonuclease Y [Patescibacteria group bacterium]
MNTLIYIIIGLILGAIVGFWIYRQKIIQETESLAHKTKEKLKEAEEKYKEIILEAKEKAATILTEAQKEERERKNQIAAMESRLLNREELLDKKIAHLTEEEQKLKQKEENLRQKEEEIQKLKLEEEKILEKISGLSYEKAKEELINRIKEKNKEELQQILEKFYKESRDEVEKKALEVITTALQRYARSNISEITTTVFPIDNEEIKGKIIGKEGRNIRAIERLTGVELVIDETPDSIVISSFDPYRRELAALALSKLIKDGRIQPAKIEEKVEEARQELDKRIMELGEQAVMDVGIYDLPRELIQILGKLHFRTSYGQNVLDHSVEMAHIAGMIAAELGLRVDVAKKGALLHDIGKAIDHEVEGNHLELGIKLLKKYGIAEDVILAMQSHHDTYPYEIPEAFVVTAADAISAARPGARRDTLENYIKRLTDLEKIATSFEGVKQAYAISAGRELRVFVSPEKIDDFGALELARAIANRIQSELKYPGEIKVNVIRETRAVEYAR